MGEAADLHATIEWLTSVASAARSSEPALVRRLEDVLGEGYGRALGLDARRRRLDRRIREFADLTAERELWVLGRERDELVQRAADLRHRLSVLREHFVALGGTRLDAAPSQSSTSP